MAFIKLIRSCTNCIYPILSNYDVDRLLISDGIILEDNVKEFDFKIQRVLTSYQLENIIMKSNERIYFIVISSQIFDSWALLQVHELYYVMDQKRSNGSSIIFEICGNKTVNEMLMV